MHYLKINFNLKNILTLHDKTSFDDFVGRFGIGNPVELNDKGKNG